MAVTTTSVTGRHRLEEGLGCGISIVLMPVGAEYSVSPHRPGMCRRRRSRIGDAVRSIPHEAAFAPPRHPVAVLLVLSARP